MSPEAIATVLSGVVVRRLVESIRRDLTAQIIENADVVVQGNRILGTGRRGSVEFPDFARIIEIPGTKNGRLYETDTLDETWPRERPLGNPAWLGNAPDGVAAGIRP